MAHPWTLLILAGVGLSFLGCKETDPSAPTEAKLSQSELAALERAYQLPERAFTNSNDGVNSAAWVLYQASVLQGTLTISGTLRETAQGLVYEASPQDRLVYQNQAGEVLARYRFDEIEGNLQGDDQVFLNNDHLFVFQVEVPGQGVLQLQSSQEGDRRTVLLEGTLTVGEDDYQVDLRTEGTYFFEVDNTGSHLRVSAQPRGTIIAQGFSEEVDEQWDYESVYATGQGGFLAENAARRFQSGWLVGNRRFQYRNGLVQSVFRDGRPTEWDVANSPWSGEGTLLMDGEPIGNLLMGAEGSYIKLWLQMGERRSELNRWRF